LGTVGSEIAHTDTPVFFIRCKATSRDLLKAVSDASA
jgi:hypothetical protein